jgi:hypothetical protein
VREERRGKGKGEREEGNEAKEEMRENEIADVVMETKPFYSIYR